MKMDFASIVGIFLAVGGIGWGISLEGGSLAEIMQPTAALIVFGGTVGATLLAQPLGTALGALKRLVLLLFEPPNKHREDIDVLMRLCADARRGGGILTIENSVDKLPDPFLKQGLRMGIDGTEPAEIREIMELRIEREFSRREAEARALEAAGGFAPTVGILGAVLGLIQVMKHLENIEEVGKGIAVAFVATIYGVGLANLFLLPAAKKFMARAEQEVTRKEMLLDGVLRLVEGRNPRTIRARMEGYLDEAPAENPGVAPETVPRAAEGS